MVNVRKASRGPLMVALRRRSISITRSHFQSCGWPYLVPLAANSANLQKQSPSLYCQHYCSVELQEGALSVFEVDQERLSVAHAEPPAWLTVSNSFSDDADNITVLQAVRCQHVGRPAFVLLSSYICYGRTEFSRPLGTKCNLGCHLPHSVSTAVNQGANAAVPCPADTYSSSAGISCSSASTALPAATALTAV